MVYFGTSLAFGAALLASPALAQDNLITSHNKVVVSLGERVVVHGLRGACGEMPNISDWEDTVPTKKGYLKLGVPGMVASAECGGNTPAVELVYVPIKRGRETIELFGDKIRVQVKR